MRLWHKDLIPVLPDKQLISQWRECCCIARNIAVNGTPNHLLVNKVLKYPPTHFHYYAGMVHDECVKRGYKVDYSKFDKWLHLYTNNCTYDELFAGWHNNRYLMQCFRNLQEKYDCGGMTIDEYIEILDKVVERIDI